MRGCPYMKEHRMSYIGQGEFVKSCPDLWCRLLADFAKPTSVHGGIVSLPEKAGHLLGQLSVIIESRSWSSAEGGETMRGILEGLRSSCPPIHSFLLHPALNVLTVEAKQSVYTVLLPIITRLKDFCRRLPPGKLCMRGAVKYSDPT